MGRLLGSDEGARCGVKRNAKWYGAKVRALLVKLQEREERRARWEATSAYTMMVDINAALEAAWVYQAQEPCPQMILMPYSSYMIMTGHTWVKRGRRGGEWRRRLNEA